MNCIFINKLKAGNARSLLALFILFPYFMFSQQQKRLISNYILTKQSKDFKNADLRDFEIDNIDSSESLKGEIIKIQQRFKGCPVYNAVGTAVIKGDKIVYFSDSFVKNYNVSTSETATLNKEKALENIAIHLGKEEIKSFKILENSPSESSHKNFTKQKLTFVEVNDNLRLAYEFSFQEPHSTNYWNVLVDANSGEIISKDNLNLSCNFHSDAYSGESTNSNNIGSENLKQNTFLKLADNASYNVFPLPIEAPTFGNRSIISNPWILASSPEGWHSTGATSYTTTRGNNVFAYEDTANTNQ